MTIDTATATMTLTDAAAAATAFAGALAERWVERQGPIRSLLLAVVAREHVLLLGPPGTAKSALVNDFAEGLGWSSFVRLLGRTTQPEELFGPWDLQGLKAGRYERLTAGYLPTAQVAFLDECFKASSPILNALLTALNERRFDQGPQRIGIPLEVAVGASNEYPEDDGLAALYDRFLVRHWVEYVGADDDFTRMLTAATTPAPRLAPEAVTALRAAAAEVNVAAVVPAIVAIRRDLSREHGIVVSDRRWRQCLGLVRAAAVLDGRTRAHARDLVVLEDALWDRAEQRPAIQQAIDAHRAPEVRALRALAASAADLVRDTLAASAADLVRDTKVPTGRIDSAQLTALSQAVVSSKALVDAACAALQTTPEGLVAATRGHEAEVRVLVDRILDAAELIRGRARAGMRI